MVSTAALRVALIHIPITHIHISLPNIHGIKGKKKVKSFPPCQMPYQAVFFLLQRLMLKANRHGNKMARLMILSETDEIVTCSIYKCYC